MAISRSFLDINMGSTPLEQNNELQIHVCSLNIAAQEQEIALVAEEIEGRAVQETQCMVFRALGVQPTHTHHGHSSYAHYSSAQLAAIDTKMRDELASMQQKRTHYRLEDKARGDNTAFENTMKGLRRLEDSGAFGNTPLSLEGLPQLKTIMNGLSRLEDSGAFRNTPLPLRDLSQLQTIDLSSTRHELSRLEDVAHRTSAVFENLIHAFSVLNLTPPLDHPLAPVSHQHINNFFENAQALMRGQREGIKKIMLQACGFSIPSECHERDWDDEFLSIIITDPLKRAIWQEAFTLCDTLIGTLQERLLVLLNIGSLSMQKLQQQVGRQMRQWQCYMNRQTEITQYHEAVNTPARSALYPGVAQQCTGVPFSELYLNGGVCLGAVLDYATCKIQNQNTCDGIQPSSRARFFQVLHSFRNHTFNTNPPTQTELVALGMPPSATTSSSTAQTAPNTSSSTLQPLYSRFYNSGSNVMFLDEIALRSTGIVLQTHTSFNRQPINSFIEELDQWSTGGHVSLRVEQEGSSTGHALYLCFQPDAYELQDVNTPGFVWHAETIDDLKMCFALWRLQNRSFTHVTHITSILPASQASSA